MAFAALADGASVNEAMAEGERWGMTLSACKGWYEKVCPVINRCTSRQSGMVMAFHLEATGGGLWLIVGSQHYSSQRPDSGFPPSRINSPVCRCWVLGGRIEHSENSEITGIALPEVVA